MLEAELNVARQIQASMLPLTFPKAPEHTRFSLFASIRAAKEVGGDFYDFGLVDDDHFFVAVGDISGKGIPAALFMAIVKTLIRSKVVGGMDPASALAATNDELCESNEEMMFSTTWLGVLNLTSGMLTYSNAGHDPPLLARKGGAVESLRDRHGLPLGPAPDQLYGTSTVLLAPSDTLYVHTDGVTEARDGTGTFFGRERLIKWAKAHGSDGVESAVQSLVRAVLEFEGDTPRSDDITVLGLQFHDHLDS